MLHDSILGVELLLRQFQNIFAWWMKWKNLDSLSCVKLWNYLDSETVKLFGQLAMKKICIDCLCELNDEIWIIIVGLGSIDFCTNCLCEPIWIITVCIDFCTSFGWTDC